MWKILLQTDMCLELFAYPASAFWRWQLQVCQEMSCRPHLPLTGSARGSQQFLRSQQNNIYMFSPVSVYVYTSIYGSTCDWRTNIPWFSWQVKYRLPCTVPSFLPLGSSRMTPTHFPEAKRVFPIYATVPRWPLPMTSTKEPTLTGRPPPSELILLLPLLVVWGQERKTLRRQKELLILSTKW